MYMIAPLAPLVPLVLFSTYLDPPSFDRIRPPLPWVARKLTPVVPSPAHLAPYPKSRPPGVSQTRNRHSLGRHCEPNPYARLHIVLPIPEFSSLLTVLSCLCHLPQCGCAVCILVDSSPKRLNT
jgi:hypothetical protein